MDTPKSASLWLTLVGTTLVYFVTLLLYRLFFHPLAKFPGPKLAAITRYYEAYYDIIKTGQYTFRIAEMHRKYGPIIRISPYELHVNDPSFFEKLYRQEGRWDKYAWSYDAFSAPYSTICTPDHDIHKMRRAPLNRFLSKQAVASKQDLIQARVEKLCSRIDEYSGSKATANLGTGLSAFTTDVATEYLIGKSYNNLERQDFNVDMSSVFQSSGFVWRITKHVRWFGPLMMSIPMSIIEKSGDKAGKAFFAFLKDSMQITKDIMATHSPGVTKDIAPPTIVDSILQSNLPPSEKRFERINDDVSTILGAGFETTAQTLRLILYHLYMHADVLERLRIELAGATAHSKGSLRLNELEQLPYLTAVIMEGLRLSPGIASRMARIAPDRELAYNDWSIPIRTPVGMTTLLVHMNDDLYPDPGRFDPERWTSLEKRRKAEKTYAPFSRGTRICVGMHLAWAELYQSIVAIVQRFDFKFEGVGPKDIECASDQFIIGTKDQNNMRVYVSQFSG